MRNLITDVSGLKVGSAHDADLASGVTALVFDAPGHRLHRRFRRRARPARRRPARTGHDRETDRRAGPVRRLGLRPRFHGRRPGAFCAKTGGDCVVAGQRVPISAGRDPVRPRQWRRQGLAAASRPIGRSAMQAAQAAAPEFRARHAWRRLWRDARRSQGRPRLGQHRDRRTVLSSAPWSPSMRWDRRPSATAAIFGRRPMSATANSAAAAGQRPLPDRALASAARKARRRKTPPSPSSPPTRGSTKAQAKRMAIMAQDGVARALAAGPCGAGRRYGLRRRHRAQRQGSRYFRADPPRRGGGRLPRPRHRPRGVRGDRTALSGTRSRVGGINSCETPGGFKKALPAITLTS